ncbi:trans-4-hydroxy-L-proline dehydratase activase [Desulforamulus putei]|uniref:trans-4-hydroxy-L-proline dehydratase activase n=1 Tax=Desulforamulus putei TaxID=74701 RepID=UPI002FDD1FEC
MKKAIVFNIQKFCIHDGPGIRTTVFFKGCPLRCLWCHNPESQSFNKEILFNPEKCTGCGQCRQRCPRGAIQATPRGWIHDNTKCIFCENCIDVCVNNAREMAGRAYTVNDLMEEIEKDRPFYEQSGGGVTLSGGEAMCQIGFVAELVKTCKKRSISVAIDTCGYVPFSSFERILGDVDVFLYDIKLMDPVLHEKYTGKDNRLILDNLQRLVAGGARINLRVPLIEGINTDRSHILDLIDFVKGLNISLVNLLPYHATGSSKYLKLHRDYPHHLLARPSDEKMEEIKNLFEVHNLKVKIGG